MAQSSTSPKWRGYLTTGVLDDPTLQVSLRSCFAEENLPALEVEPGRVFVLTGYGAKTIEVWTQQRTRVRLSDDCLAIPFQSQTSTYVQLAEYSDVPVRFAGGYQILVYQSFDGDALTIQSELDGGELGAPTEEIPLPGETQVEYRDYLDGGLACNRVLRTINGVAGPSIELRGELGVLIESHPGLSRVVVDVNGEAMTVCPGFPAPEPVACVPNPNETCGEINGELKNCPPGDPDLRGGYDGRIIEATITPSIYDPRVQVVANAGQVGRRVSGGCRYKRQNGQWVLMSSNLGVNYDCGTPTYNGHEGQEVIMPGRPVIGDPMTHVRNPYFLDSLRYWLVSDGVLGSQAGPVIDLPYVSLQAGGRLEQAAVPLGSAAYIFQAKVRGSGSVTVQLINVYGVIAQQVVFEVRSTDSEIVSTPFTMISGIYDLTIVAENPLDITQISLTVQ